MNIHHRLPPARVYHGRKPRLAELCRGKRVLHLGCVDAGHMQEQIRAGTLLHLKLLEVAAEVWGLDLDAEGIQAMQRMGIPNLLAGNVESLHEVPALQGQSFDVVLASEVLEHVQNPGLFLESIKPWVRTGAKFVLTIPHAFSFDVAWYLLRNVEQVHPDHNYWFSYRTIRTLLEKSGYRLDDVALYSSHYGIGWKPARGLRSRLKAAVAWLLSRPSPFLGANGLIVTASPNS
ncbi:MAG: methyltransferase domain-containing protein [Candidatus Eremiobacterota bacterium]